MEEKYKEFEVFNWNDERWHTYLDGLYPAPSYKQVGKFKKKWYKKHIDPEFDETYDPSSSSTAPGASAGSGSSGGSGGTLRGSVAGDSAPRWAGKGQRATLCLVAYLLGAAAAVASLAGLTDTLRPILLLSGAFAAEIVAKHGVQFNYAYLQGVAVEDACLLPFFAAATCMPGSHTAFRLLVLVPFVLQAIISIAGICAYHTGTPGFVKRLFAKISDTSVRFQLMQIRADTEVGLLFGIVAGTFARMVTPVAPLLCANVLVARYASSAWTRASFRKVDGTLSPLFGKVPFVSKMYDKFRDALYGYATGDYGGGGAGGGRSCTLQ